MKRIILFIILTTSAICYGLNEIRVYYPSNHSVFSTVRNQSGQIWNGSAFEDFNDIYDCNIPMTDKLGGLYLGNFPSCDANSYTIMSYFDSDSTPDNNDVLIQIEEGYWTGTLWRSSRDRLEDIKAETGLIVEDTGTAIPNTLTALRSAMDANFASLDFDTSGIDANFVTLRNAMDANFANIDNDFPTTEEIRAEIDSNSTQLAAILEDTGTTIPSLITDVNIPDINSDLETIKTGIENILNRIIYKFIQINGD